MWASIVVVLVLQEWLIFIEASRFPERYMYNIGGLSSQTFIDMFSADNVSLADWSRGYR